MTTCCEISIPAFLRNLTKVKNIVGDDVEVMPVLKADAYGHGDFELTRAALNSGCCSIIAVGTPEEAILLRKKGITASILTLDGITYGYERELIINNISSVISSSRQIDLFSKEAERLKMTVSVHLKVDTGMSRLGSGADNIEKLFYQASRSSRISIKGIMTHLASSAKPSVRFAHIQIERFKHSVEGLSKKGFKIPLIHAANSGAVLYYKNAHFNMVRPGIILYGSLPDSSLKNAYCFEPVMTFKTSIIHINMIKKGEGISYNRTYVADRDTVIGVIPVGYSHGFSRILSNKAEAIIKGVKVPQRGTICMNLSVIDITDVHGVKVGDEVVLIGKQEKEKITIDDVASKAGTISYELMCMIGKAVRRVYTN